MEKIEVVFEPNDPIVAMVEWRGAVYVATSRRVFRMERDEFTKTDYFKPVVFHQETQ